MKIFAGLFLLLLTISIHAQTTEDALLIREYQTAQNNLYDCYTKFWEDKTENKSKNLNECRDLRIAELASVYGKLSSRPSAIKLLLGNEIGDKYRESSARLKGVGDTKTERNLESLVELQRITVIQNQRIIELLEKLLLKK